MPPILILGEAPGPRAGGLTRRRVSELAGRPWEEWAVWRNLLDDYPGRGRGKGSAWNQRAARQAWEEMEIHGYAAVVMLGRRVAAAIIPGGGGFPFFHWTNLEFDIYGAVIPHTSGIVRFWNDPENVAKAERFFAEMLAEHASDAPAKLLA